MFLGLRTVIYKPGDLDKTKAWYREMLGIDPYFDEPFYLGFDVGGYELGFDPNGAPPSADAGVSAYWGVANIEQALGRLLELGATAHSPIADVGDGVKLASVVDPFGNRVGIIENPHFKVK